MTEKLKKIGNSIGKLLKNDICTSSILRGRYARICVQIPLEEPVLSSMKIGKNIHPIMYEGQGFLCTTCGRLGNTANKCLQVKIHSDPGINTSPMEPKTKLEDEWNTVKFQKRSPILK